jgi:hypothetical protein
MKEHSHCGKLIEIEFCQSTPGQPCYEQTKAFHDLGMPAPYEGRDPRVTEALEEAEGEAEKLDFPPEL